MHAGERCRITDRRTVVSDRQTTVGIRNRSEGFLYLSPGSYRLVSPSVPCRPATEQPASHSGPVPGTHRQESQSRGNRSLGGSGGWNVDGETRRLADLRCVGLSSMTKSRTTNTLVRKHKGSGSTAAGMYTGGGNPIMPATSFDGCNARFRH